MKRLRFLHAVALAMAFSIVGAGVASAQAKLDKVKIRLDWKGGSQHAPFYYGKEKGFFRDEGIDIEVISGSGSSDTVKQVGSGAVEFGLVDALVLVQAAQQRVPIKAIAAYYQRSPIVVISPKAKPITDPKQLLQGVKLGSKKGSATYQGLVALLSANDIQLEKITLVDIGFGVAPLLVKQVDAIMGFEMNEPIEAETGGMPTHVMPIADYGVDTYGLTLVTNNSIIKDNPGLVERFLKATARAMTAAEKDPKGTVAAVVKSVQEADADREAKVFARTTPYWHGKDTDANGVGWQTGARWQTTIDVARKLGLIESALDPASLHDDTFIAKLKVK